MAKSNKSVYWATLTAGFVLSIILFLTYKPASAQLHQAFDHDLDGYTKQTPAVLLDIAHDASGVTYNPITNTLFIIRSKAPAIYETTIHGELIRKIQLHRFQDTEGIVWMKNDQFAVIEERTCSIVLINLSAHIKAIDKLTQHAIEIPHLNTNKDNSGCEDIAWHPQENAFYIVQEKKPAAVYRVSQFMSASINITPMIDNELHPQIGRDLSGLYFERSSQSLFMLSHESKHITQLNNHHMPSLPFKLGWFDNGLIKAIPQAEGITGDNQGNLFIVSEPNLLYMFNKNVN